MKRIIGFLSASLIILSVVSSQASATTTQLPPAQLLKSLLEKHKGDVIYLDFWASWCSPCRQSFPWLNSMQETYQGQGFNVISVNLDANYSLATDFLKETPVLFSVVFDPKGKTAKQYKVKGMPTSYLINREGVIVKGHTGFFPDKIPTYESEIKQLMQQ